jgi:hypothetical protein
MGDLGAVINGNSLCLSENSDTKIFKNQLFKQKQHLDIWLTSHSLQVAKC